MAGGTRYGCDIRSGGTIYPATDGPGGPILRGTIHGVTDPGFNHRSFRSGLFSSFSPKLRDKIRDRKPEFEARIVLHASLFVNIQLARHTLAPSSVMNLGFEVA